MELTALCLIVGMHLVIGTDAAIPFGWLNLTLFSYYAIVFWVLVRLALGAITFRRMRPRLSRWAEAGVVVILLLLIHGTNLGVTVRVLLSEDELLEEVRSAQSSKHDRFECSNTCGLFTIQARYKNRGLKRKDDSGIVWLRTVRGERLFVPPYSLSGGLVYCEEGEPPSTGDSHYQHLYGPWWVYLEDV